MKTNWKNIKTKVSNSLFLVGGIGVAVFGGLVLIAGMDNIRTGLVEVNEIILALVFAMVCVIAGIEAVVLYWKYDGNLFAEDC